MKKTGLLISVLIAAVALSACGAQNVPTLLPTVDPIIIEQTVGAVQTKNAEYEAATLTQQALASPTPLPTYTLLPSSTLLPTNTAFPTWTPAPPTATGQPVTVTPHIIGTQATSTPKTYDCDIISYSPSESKIFKPNQNFDGIWTVKNTGTKAWSTANTDVVWLENTKMVSVSSSYDLPEDTATGKTVELTVDMKAPGYSGNFWTTWTLKISNTKFCKMTFFIAVRK